MAGKVITPRQLAQQWLRLPNKFEVNVFNFETLVGNAAKKYLETLLSPAVQFSRNFFLAIQT